MTKRRVALTFNGFLLIAGATQLVALTQAANAPEEPVEKLTQSFPQVSLPIPLASMQSRRDESPTLLPPE